MMGSQTFAQTPEMTSYVLQQRRRTYINFGVNRLVNICLLKPANYVLNIRRCEYKISFTLVTLLAGTLRLGRSPHKALVLGKIRRRSTET